MSSLRHISLPPQLHSVVPPTTAIKKEQSVVESAQMVVI